MINFIINGKAGNGRTLRAKNKISKILEKKGVEYKFHLTEHAKHATEIARELCEKGEKEIVAVGGDGTVHEVLNGLTHLEDIHFGIIPVGSGNDFVTSAKIPNKLKPALDIVLEGNTKPTDFLVCDKIRGLNIIGTGIDVEILTRCEKNKIFVGKLKYLVSLIMSVIKFKSYDFSFTKDGKDEHRKGFIICCCNGKNLGGGIKMCPVAVPDDGIMETVVVNYATKRKIWGYFFKLMKGKILEQPACEHYRDEKVQAVFENPISVEIDGEIYDNIKFDVHIEKGKLNLYRP